MTNFETEGGADRSDLVARLDLMETMIAEGRQATFRNGWIFVLWGVVDIAGMALDLEHPNHQWNWPVIIAVGLILQFVGLGIRRSTGREGPANTQSRALAAIWGMMGVSLILYCLTAIFTHLAGDATYVAAIFMILGTAHAASAIILRWRLQGAVAGLWWAGGLACFFLSGGWYLVIFCLEMLFGMIAFGLYAMVLERIAIERGSVHA